MRAAAAAALALALLPAATQAREETSFSRAWRWHFGPGGDDSGPGPGNAWAAAFAPISGCDAADMYPDPHRMTSSDCATACAYDPSCFAYIHDPNAATRTCAHAGAGATCTPAATNATTIGGRRAAPTPLQTAYAFAAAALPAAAGWPLVDAPHDALFSLNGSFSESGGDERHGYRVRTVVWYRKTFALPAEWASGGAVFVRFEGVVHFAQLYLNGAFLGAHASAYGEFVVRLDNVSGVVFGGDNVLAVRADASYGSEHWYGGGGITRPVQLVRVGALAFVEHGVFVPAELPAGSTTAAASAEFENFGAAAAAAVRFDVFDAAGALVATATTAAAAPPANGGGTVVVTAPLALPPDVALWSVAAPALFRVCATLVSAGGGVEDSVNVTVGFKRVGWDANAGFSLNGAGFRLRGFSHHNSFAGVGVAIPARLDLFRVQVARALGSNIWRMSHNPYRTSLYDILDATGTAVWDENRDFGPSYAYQMGEMVKRGRNHASIVVNSLCNEIECVNQPAVGREMVALARAQDPTKKTTANSNANDGLSADIDVQGLSHAAAATFAAAHAANPAQPLVLSECCSCSTQRLPRETADACMAKENAPGIDLPFVAGSLGVWTLFDYQGEPPGPWPYVSSSFGQLDFPGFPKPHAYWYTTNWRELPAAGTPFAARAPTARVLDLPSALAAAGFVSAITSAPSAELIVDGVSLGVRASNGSVLTWPLAPRPAAAAAAAGFPVNSSGVQCHGLQALHKGDASAAACAAAACAAGADMWQYEASAAGCWAGTAAATPCPPPVKPGTTWVGARRAAPVAAFQNATLVARDARGATVATHTVRAPSAAPALALALALDVPSAATGTGSRVLLDGADCALVRVSVVDAANGALVIGADVNVTFTVLSGPARVAGSGNGDPTSHDQPNGATLPTFGGLARGILVATVDCVSADRDRARAVDVDGAAGPTAVLPVGAPCPAEDIVVAVDAVGFARATIAIPVSGDAEVDGVMAAARAGLGAGAIGYVDGFEG